MQYNKHFILISNLIIVQLVLITQMYALGQEQNPKFPKSSLQFINLEINKEDKYIEGLLYIDHTDKPNQGLMCGHNFYEEDGQVACNYFGLGNVDYLEILNESECEEGYDMVDPPVNCTGDEDKFEDCQVDTTFQPGTECNQCVLLSCAADSNQIKQYENEFLNANGGNGGKKYDDDDDNDDDNNDNLNNIQLQQEDTTDESSFGDAEYLAIISVLGFFLITSIILLICCYKQSQKQQKLKEKKHNLELETLKNQNLKINKEISQLQNEKQYFQSQMAINSGANMFQQVTANNNSGNDSNSIGKNFMQNTFSVQQQQQLFYQQQLQQQNLQLQNPQLLVQQQQQMLQLQQQQLMFPSTHINPFSSILNGPNNQNQQQIQNQNNYQQQSLDQFDSQYIQNQKMRNNTIDNDIKQIQSQYPQSNTELKQVQSQYMQQQSIQNKLSQQQAQQYVPISIIKQQSQGIQGKSRKSQETNPIFQEENEMSESDFKQKKRKQGEKFQMQVSTDNFKNNGSVSSTEKNKQQQNQIKSFNQVCYESTETGGMTQKKESKNFYNQQQKQQIIYDENEGNQQTQKSQKNIINEDHNKNNMYSNNNNNKDQELKCPPIDQKNAFKSQASKQTSKQITQKHIIEEDEQIVQKDSVKEEEEEDDIEINKIFNKHQIQLQQQVQDQQYGNEVINNNQIIFQ